MLNRAYSLLEVKAVTEEGDFYVVRGTATTPTPDRVNDVIEPLGATFAETLPLLWQHQSDKPVGLAQFEKPTRKGIKFVARLPIVKEVGALRDRIEEAVQSIRYRLVAAVSIGFRAIGDEVERIQNGGLRFLKTEILELSLVTIPAQAEATITSIKSIDTQLRAASGRMQKGISLIKSPDVSGTKQAVKRGPVKLIPRKRRNENAERPDQGSGEHPCG